VSSKVFISEVFTSIVEMSSELFFFCFRLQRLEESLKDDSMSEAQRIEKRQRHAVKETEFLRLKRSRLGPDDFDPIKVIGKGAFGEVRLFTGFELKLL
jgi:hypothetical protein